MQEDFIKKASAQDLSQLGLQTIPRPVFGTDLELQPVEQRLKYVQVRLQSTPWFSPVHDFKGSARPVTFHDFMQSNAHLGRIFGAHTQTDDTDSAD